MCCETSEAFGLWEELDKPWYLLLFPFKLKWELFCLSSPSSAVNSLGGPEQGPCCRWASPAVLSFSYPG